MPRGRNHFVQHPVGLDANAELVLKRLEVDVAGMVLDGHQQHHVQQLADRGAVRQRLDAGQVDRTVRAGGGGDRPPQFVVFLQLAQDGFDALAFAGVVLAQGPLDVALGGHHQADVVAQKVPQFVLDGQVLRIASGQGQRAVVQHDRDHAIQLGHRVGDRGEHGTIQLDLAQVDHLHVHLLGQRLSQLLVGDQRHLFGDLAQQFTGPLLLLLQQHLQLLVGDESEIDQNLSDAANGHN